MGQGWHGISKRLYILLWKWNANHLRAGFLVHKGAMSALKRVESVSDRMPQKAVRWCDINVLNVHAPTEDKCDDIKDSIYEELEYVFDKFPKHNTQILLVYFNENVGMDIFIHNWDVSL
jgi:hypothetical protein